MVSLVLLVDADCIFSIFALRPGWRYRLRWCGCCRAAPAPHFPARYSHTIVGRAYPPPSYQQRPPSLHPRLCWLDPQLLFSLLTARPPCGRAGAWSPCPVLPGCGGISPPCDAALRHHPQDEGAQGRDILGLLHFLTDSCRRGPEHLFETQGCAANAPPRQATQPEEPRQHRQQHQT
jgi:hypothetical protein